MMSLKSMDISYYCLTELESKGLFSTCSKFMMYVGESIEVLRFKKARERRQGLRLL